MRSILHNSEPSARADVQIAIPLLPRCVSCRIGNIALFQCRQRATLYIYQPFGAALYTHVRLRSIYHQLPKLNISLPHFGLAGPRNVGTTRRFFSCGAPPASAAAAAGGGDVITIADGAACAAGACALTAALRAAASAEGVAAAGSAASASAGAPAVTGGGG